ncbi:MAG: hypothetical protein KGL39_12540 [Patescibacteria group bacterium]|nr:hypothetical protein [Patescibacteria group bacterium]
MTALLWLDEKTDDAIDLGDSFRLFQVHAELAHVCGERYDQYPELFGVLGSVLDQEDVGQETLFKIQNQARTFLTQHGSELGDYTRSILGKLVGDFRE